MLLTLSHKRGNSEKLKEISSNSLVCGKSWQKQVKTDWQACYGRANRLGRKYRKL